MRARVAKTPVENNVGESIFKSQIHVMTVLTGGLIRRKRLARIRHLIRII